MESTDDHFKGHKMRGQRARLMESERMYMRLYFDNVEEGDRLFMRNRHT